MDVTRDEAAEIRFYEDMAAWLRKRDRERRPHEWHVSDLLTPRKTYWRIVDPRPPTQDELGYYLAGRAHHEVMEAIVAGEDGELEKTVTMRDGETVIVGHPDVVLRPTRLGAAVPVEIKTSRKWTIDEEPEDRYLDQLCCYCAMLGESTGVLIVFYITPGRDPKGQKATKPRIVAWKVTFTAEELVQCQDYLVKVARALDRALARRDHTKLPLCEEWQCWTRRKMGRGKTARYTYTIQCPYFDQCRPAGRWPIEEG